jgi:hypothetical protein
VRLRLINRIFDTSGLVFGWIDCNNEVFFGDILHRCSTLTY